MENKYRKTNVKTFGGFYSSLPAKYWLPQHTRSRIHACRGGKSLVGTGVFCSFRTGVGRVFASLESV